MRANLRSISHRCILFKAAFVHGCRLRKLSICPWFASRAASAWLIAWPLENLALPSYGEQCVVGIVVEGEERAFNTFKTSITLLVSHDKRTECTKCHGFLTLSFCTSPRPSAMKPSFFNPPWGAGGATCRLVDPRVQPPCLSVQLYAGRGAARAEDARGTPTQSHISPSMLVYEGKEGVLIPVPPLIG